MLTELKHGGGSIMASFSDNRDSQILICSTSCDTSYKETVHPNASLVKRNSSYLEYAVKLPRVSVHCLSFIILVKWVLLMLFSTQLNQMCNWKCLTESDVTVIKKSITSGARTANPNSSPSALCLPSPHQ